jgi:ribosomal protein S10
MSLIINKGSEKFKEYDNNVNYRLRLIEGTKDQFRVLHRMVETSTFSIPTNSNDLEVLQTPLTESHNGKNFEAKAIIRNVDVTKFIKNLNERIYSKPLWEKVMLSMIAEGSACLADHPADDDPGSVLRTMGIWHNFRLGEATGKADLYVLSEGMKIVEVVKAGGKAGFSTVGYGEMLSDGITVNPDTYELERLADWVINPSQQVYATTENMIETFQESEKKEKSSIKEDVDIELGKGETAQSSNITNTGFFKPGTKDEFSSGKEPNPQELKVLANMLQKVGFLKDMIKFDTNTMDISVKNTGNILSVIMRSDSGKELINKTIKDPQSIKQFNDTFGTNSYQTLLDISKFPFQEEVESIALLHKSDDTNINKKIIKETVSMSEKLEKINIASYKANLKKTIKEALKLENKKEAFEKISTLREEAEEALGIDSDENQEIQTTADQALENIISDLQTVVDTTKEDLSNITLEKGKTDEEKSALASDLEASTAVIEEMKKKYKRVLEIASTMQEEYNKLKNMKEEEGDDESTEEAPAEDGADIPEEGEGEEMEAGTTEGASITIGDDVQILINDPNEQVTYTGDEGNLDIEADMDEDEGGEEGEEDAFEIETAEDMEEAVKKMKTTKKTNVKKLNKGKIDVTAKTKYQGAKKPSKSVKSKESVEMDLFKRVIKKEAELPAMARAMSTSTSSTTSHDKNFGDDFPGMTAEEKKEYSEWKKHWNRKQEAAKARKIKEAEGDEDLEGLGGGTDEALDAPTDDTADTGIDMGTSEGGDKDNVEINIKVPTKENYNLFKKFLDTIPKGQYTEKSLAEAFAKFKKKEKGENKNDVKGTNQFKGFNERKEVVFTEAQFLNKFGIKDLKEVEDITAKVYPKRFKEDDGLFTPEKTEEEKRLEANASPETPVIPTQEVAVTPEIGIVESYYNTLTAKNPDLVQIKEEILATKSLEEAKLKINEFVNKKADEKKELFNESTVSTANPNDFNTFMNKSWIPKGYK